MIQFDLSVWGKSNVGKHLLDLLPCSAQRLDHRVLEHVLSAAQVELLSLDVDHQDEGLDNGAVREYLHGVVGNCAH